MNGRRAAVRRTGWSVADQALSSLGNLLLGLLVARTVGREEFGAFALAYLLYRLCVGLSRAFASEPLVVRHSGEADVEPLRRSVGVAVEVGLALGAVTLVGAGVVGGSVGRTLLALGVTLPGLLAQDAWRHAFLAQGRPACAAANDLAWTVSQFALIALLLVGGPVDAASLVWAWGLSGCLAAALGAVQLRRLPVLGSSTRWLRRHRDLAPTFVVEFALAQGVQQVTLWAVGAFVGLAGLGALRAGQIVLGPLQVLFVSVPLFAIPEGVALHRRGGGLVRAGAALSGACVLVSAVYGAALLLVPQRLGTALLGAQWEPAQTVLPALVASWVALAAATGPVVGLRVLASARRSLRVRLLAVPFSVAAGLAGAWTGGAVGGAAGLATATALSTVVWWRAFLASAARDARPGQEDLEGRRRVADGGSGTWTGDGNEDDGSPTAPSRVRGPSGAGTPDGGAAVAGAPAGGSGPRGQACLRGAGPSPGRG